MGHRFTRTGRMRTDFFNNAEPSNVNIALEGFLLLGRLFHNWLFAPLPETRTILCQLSNPFALRKSAYLSFERVSGPYTFDTLYLTILYRLQILQQVTTLFIGQSVAESMSGIAVAGDRGVVHIR